MDTNTTDTIPTDTIPTDAIPADHPPLPTTVRFGGSDHRAELSAAMQLAESVVARIPGADYDRATPCGDRTVAEVIGHLHFVSRRLEALYRGMPEPTGVWDRPAPDPAVSAAVVAAGRARLEWLLADPAVLDGTINPWRPMSVRESLPLYVSEFIMHSWDLAAAAGLDVEWDPALVAMSQEAMECEVPAELRSVIFAGAIAAGFEVPFGDAVEPAPDASPVDRLAAYVGRVRPA